MSILLVRACVRVVCVCVLCVCARARALNPYPICRRNVREQRQRVKKQTGCCVKKRRSDVRWRWVSVGEKKESAAKQSTELVCVHVLRLFSSCTQKNVDTECKIR
jgi:hypothetical protein